MSITRYQMEMVEGGQYDNAEYVKFSDYLEEVTSLEYDIRYEREQKEELQEELKKTQEVLEYYKKLVSENCGISGLGC